MKKIKSILCSLNSKYIHSSLGVWCLLAGAKQLCIDSVDVEVVEGTINEERGIIIERLLEKDADVICFSCYIWNITLVLQVAKEMKLLRPDVKIILGGPEVSYNQTQRLESLEFVDFILSGEGEMSFASLMNSFSSGESFSEIAGLAFRKDDNIIENQPEFLQPEQCFSPYTEEYFSALGNRICYIESSRGCPYSCAFCLSGRCGGVRFYPLERTFKEMLLLCEHGAKTIKFVDRTFNCNKKRSIDIFNFIKENYGTKIPKDVCFHFEIAADILDKNVLDTIKTLPIGSIQFEAGIQTLNSKTLEYINRKTDMKKLDENLKTLISFGNCHVHIDLIAGLPYEGIDSFIDGFNEAYWLKSSMLQLGFLKILHGSPMDMDKEKFPCEFTDTPPYEVIATPWISENELDILRGVEDALERLYNSGRFRRTLDYIINASQSTPFKVLIDFSDYLKDKSTLKIPLDKYTEFVYSFFSTYNGINAEHLRDFMILDRITTNSSTIIPKVLHVKDKKLKKIKAELISRFDLSSVKHSVAILYSQNKVALCTYETQNPVTSQYPLKMLNFSEFEEIEE